MSVEFIKAILKDRPLEPETIEKLEGYYPEWQDGFYAGIRVATEILKEVNKVKH